MASYYMISEDFKNNIIGYNKYGNPMVWIDKILLLKAITPNIRSYGHLSIAQIDFIDQEDEEYVAKFTLDLNQLEEGLVLKDIDISTKKDDVVAEKLYNFTCRIEEQKINKEGMIYNPYTNKWSWL